MEPMEPMEPMEEMRDQSMQGVEVARRSSSRRFQGILNRQISLYRQEVKNREEGMSVRKCM